MNESILLAELNTKIKEAREANAQNIKDTKQNIIDNQEHIGEYRRQIMAMEWVLRNVELSDESRDAIKSTKDDVEEDIQITHRGIDKLQVKHDELQNMCDILFNIASVIE